MTECRHCHSADCPTHKGQRRRGYDPDCVLCQTVDHINRMFAELEPQSPRYRYWRIKRSKGKSERTFEYTTETADGGKYWALERKWVRVKGGEQGKIVRKVGFKQRKKAKERAYAWYTKAQTSATSNTVG